MNTVIGGAVGVVLAVFGVIGGVSAYNGSPEGVAQEQPLQLLRQLTHRFVTVPTGAVCMSDGEAVSSCN